MDRRETYRALVLKREAHPTETWMVPVNPHQVVHDLANMDKEFIETSIPYWTATPTTITSYEDLAAIITPFDILHAGSLEFIVGDESALDGSPPNALANMLWVASSLDGNARFGTPMPGLPDKPFLIYGPCVVCGPADGEGYETSVPDWACEMVKRLASDWSLE